MEIKSENTVETVVGWGDLSDREIAALLKSTRFGTPRRGCVSIAATVGPYIWKYFNPLVPCDPLDAFVLDITLDMQTYQVSGSVISMMDLQRVNVGLFQPKGLALVSILLQRISNDIYVEVNKRIQYWATHNDELPF